MRVLFNRGLVSGRRSYTKWSYWHQLGERPLLGTTIGTLVERSAESYPDRVAIVSRHQNASVTFRDLLDKTNKTAVVLHRLGLKKGDRVGLWAPNCVEWEVTSLACSRLGLTVALLNPAYKSDEIAYCINKVGVKCLVCPERIGKQNYYEVLNEIDEGLARSERSNLRMGQVPTLRHVVVISDNVLRGVHNYEELVSHVHDADTRFVDSRNEAVQIDDASTIMFTSGSTGNPKAAVLSHFSLVNNAYLVGKRLRLDTEQHRKILVQVPFFHTFGTTAAILSGLHYGATLVLGNDVYNPTKNLEALCEEKCDVVYGTPTMHVDLTNRQKELNLPISPSVAVSGGSPITPALIQQMYDVYKIKDFVQVYGLTESTAMNFQGHLNADMETVVNTVGQLTDHLEVKVCDKEGNVVPLGTPGELYIRGYSTMLGYYGDEEKTRETIDEHGWMKTGDKFVLLENGYGKVIGRLKDMIIRGGENIYPKEIEEFLSHHPNIVDCQVIGIPHERLGEEVCVCIKLQPNTDLTLKDVAEYCKGKIAHYKVPSKVYVMDDFPKTTSGKIQKFKLVQLVAELEARSKTT